MDQEKQIQVARLLNQFLRDESVTASDFVAGHPQSTEEAQEAVFIAESIARYSAIPAPSEAGRQRAVRAIQKRRREINLTELRKRASEVIFRDVRQYAQDLVGAQLILNRSSQPSHSLQQDWHQRAYNQRVHDQQARDGATNLIQEMREVAAYQLPVEPKRVAEYLGILVREFSLVDIEGCLFRNEGLVAMLLNSGTPNGPRKRFTCAHEIGHGVLHKDVVAFDDSSSSISDYSDVRERQANVFASYLLAPIHEILPLLKGAPCIEQADAIRERFDLSLAASLIRLVIDTDWDCALVASHLGRIQWTFAGEHFPGFIPKGKALPLSSFAYSLEKKDAATTGAATVEAGQWLPQDVWFHEESRRTTSGWIYTLLTPTQAP